MKIIDESDKFDNPFMLTKALSYIYEKEKVIITQFQHHMHFSLEKLDEYIRRLKVHELIDVKTVKGKQYIKRTPSLGRILAAFFLNMVDNKWIKKEQPKREKPPEDVEYIIPTEKFIRLCIEEEKALIRIAPKLEKENFL